MRIFLINPPTNYEEGAVLLEPLGLCYIAAACREAGHEVALMDMLDVRSASADELFARMDAFAPDVVALTAMTENFANGVRIASAAKARYGATIVFGGWHVSGEPQSILEPAIDYIVVGEGELTMLELLDYLGGHIASRDEISGLVFKTPDGGYKKTESRKRIRKLAELPRPMREGLPLERYSMLSLFSEPKSRMRTLSVQASRGCPYTCSFCQTPAIWGTLSMRRPPAAVADEVRDLVDTYDVNTMLFRDEEFSVNTKWVIEICNELVKRGVQNRLTWGAFCRVDDITTELVAAMHEAGCAYVLMGLEAGTPEQRARMRKFYKQDEAERAVAILNEYDITTQAGWIVGMPSDSLDDIESAFQWLLTLPVDFVYFTYPVPFGGTPLRRDVEEQGLLITTDGEKFNCKHPIIRHPTIPMEVLLTLPDSFARRFYLRPSYVKRLARRMIMNPKRALAAWEIAKSFVFKDNLFTRGARISSKTERWGRGFEIPRRYHEPLAPRAPSPARAPELRL